MRYILQKQNGHKRSYIQQNEGIKGRYIQQNEREIEALHLANMRSYTHQNKGNVKKLNKINGNRGV